MPPGSMLITVAMLNVEINEEYGFLYAKLVAAEIQPVI